jgi:hypothetical protein
MSRSSDRCVSCDESRPGRYCASCGEKRVGSEDRKLRHIAAHGVEMATNANGTVFLTLRTLFSFPGRLTADYFRGKRKPYMAPLQLFLLANLIYFLLHPLIGSNTLTTGLNAHLHYSWHQGLARAMTAPRLAARAITVEAYATIFDAAAITQAKSLVILVVPIFSLAVAVFYWRHRRSYVFHLIFATHICAYWLLLICATMALTNLSIRLLRTVDVFPSAEQVSASVLIVTLPIMAVYLFRAARVVFDRQAGWLTVAQAIALSVAFELSLQAYRCALFFITFWST